MKNGTNVPMGPLQLADFIGLVLYSPTPFPDIYVDVSDQDTCYAIMRVLYEDTGDSKYRPSVMLGKMVDAGWLGKKAGKGFYDYPTK